MLVEKGPHGLLVAAANGAARGCGIDTGLGFTDARARAPDIKAIPIDRAADKSALKALALWMIRVTPLMSLDGEDGLYLETTGCERYHGGEAALFAHVSNLLTKNAIPHQLAMAGTPGAAHALARYHTGTDQRRRLANGEERTGLAPLPCQGLRLSAEVTGLLRRFGLTRIGQLYDIDRRALARRFRAKHQCDAVLLRLDQALGLRREPVVPLTPPPLFSAALPCPEPLISTPALLLGLEKLAADLSIQLKHQNKGAQAFTFHGFRANGEHDAVHLTTARACADADHLVYLFRDRIEKINPGFGIEHLVLQADRTSALETITTPLAGTLTGGGADPQATAELVDRLTAKLGPHSVAVSTFAARHLPEKAEGRSVFDGAWPAKPSPFSMRGPRPQRLINPPEPITVLAEVPDGPPRTFRWRRVQRHVLKADGPERLAPEWWQHTAPVTVTTDPQKGSRTWLTPKLDPRADAEQICKGRTQIEKSLVDDHERAPVKKPRTRDYYRIEDDQGRRYWIYRDGLYDDNRGGTPTWFMHGLFA
ncbi:MAG: DNA polymerase Y family protein [Pseudomonadota bacterium]